MTTIPHIQNIITFAVIDFFKMMSFIFFKTHVPIYQPLISLQISAVIRLKYCQYGVKHYAINQHYKFCVFQIFQFSQFFLPCRNRTGVSESCCREAGSRTHSANRVWRSATLWGPGSRKSSPAGPGSHQRRFHVSYLLTPVINKQSV